METDKFKPNHYHSQPFNSSLVQETIFTNILGSYVGDIPDGAEQIKLAYNKEAIKAMWVSFAAKHLLRAGLKDDVDIELKKAENYLHKARTGEWLSD